MFYSNIFLFTFFLFVSNTCFSNGSFEISLKPNCRNCKYYLQNNNNLYEQGLCSLFSNKLNYGKAEIIVHKYAIQCRLNSNLCGMDGSSFIHKDKNTNSEKTKKEKTKLNELYKEMEEIESNFNGEICEKDEIKILENELDLLKKKIDELKSKM